MGVSRAGRFTLSHACRQVKEGPSQDMRPTRVSEDVAPAMASLRAFALAKGDAPIRGRL